MMPGCFSQPGIFLTLMLAAAHAVHFCGDVARLLTCQINIYRGQFRRLPRTFHRRLLTKLRILLAFVRRKFAVLSRSGLARQYSPEYLSRHLFRQATAVVQNRRLCSPHSPVNADLAGCLDLCEVVMILAPFGSRGLLPGLARTARKR